MALQIISALFPAAEPLTFRCLLNGKPFATQWTTYAGEVAGIHGFDFLLEVDPTVIGSGGAAVRARAHLDCDAAMRPLRYNTETNGAVAMVAFDSDHISVALPSGARKSYPRAGAEWLMETYMIGLDALFYVNATSQGRLADGGVFKNFFVNQLLVAPYTVTAAPDLVAKSAGRCYRTSYDEEVEVDEHGVMQIVRNPKYGIDTVLVRPAPPLPEWRNEMLVTKVKRATYRRPDGATFTSEDVTIHGSDVPVGATVTVPTGQAPHPAILFLPGSGALDRNGMTGELDLGSHEIVDHLSSHGFLGLRFDKRGAGTTPQGPDVENATTLEAIIRDGQAALAYLQSRPDVDPKRVFLVGHSEGATVAVVLVTQRGAEVAGIALLGSRGRGMDEISLQQTEATARHRGQTDEQIQAQLTQVKRFFELVKSGTEWKPEDIPDQLYLGANTVPWLRDHFNYPVEELIEEVKCPVAVFHGESDWQVPVEQGAELAERARAARVPVTYRPQPKLDHLFKRAEGESTMASYFTDRRVDAHFLDELTAWLDEQRQAR